MARIKVSRSFKDDIDRKPHATLSRRDFMARGLLTGAATVFMPHALSAVLARQAFGGQTNCPTHTATPGGLAQLFREGGPTLGAMFLNQTQVNMMNASIGSRYGINPSDIAQVGSNWYLATSSPFAIALMTPPPGFSQSTWNAVLMRTSLGGHYGPFNADDGAGINTGLLGASASTKSSSLGHDLRINNQNTLASWAQGTPSTSVGGGTQNLTAASIAKNFSITPSGKITPAVMTNSAQASDSLSQIFMNLFGSSRTGLSAGISKAVCGFYGDSQIANPTFGTSLFDPTQVAPLMNAIQVANLSAEEQALLAAYYQSATGSISGVMVQQSNCDYHGKSVQNDIGPSDYEAGRMFAMFFAACAVAQTRGAMISLHNGQAIAGNSTGMPADNANVGFVTTTINVNNQNINIKGPAAQGDAGGSYNAGFILCYDPSSAPTLSSTGTFNTSSGDVTAASAVSSNTEAVAGLYLTAFAYLGLNVNQAAAAMQTVGVTSNISSIMLIS